MHKYNVLQTALIAGTSLTKAHMLMIEPQPYNLDTAPLVQTWPLDDKLPFPCQGRTEHAEKVTKMTAGTTQTVKFLGSAIHGGGSCQFAVAYGDQAPSDPSGWHTIYSIIGGCPGEAAAGNLQTNGKDPHGREDGPHCNNDRDTECVRDFYVPIPKEMKNGKAIFAWTWFNKIGNREMYMNCAPVEIEGGSGDEAFIKELPPVFVANIPGKCTTKEGGSVLGFPNPGKFGQFYGHPTLDSQGSCPAGVLPDTFKSGSTGGTSNSGGSSQGPPAGSGTSMTTTSTASDSFASAPPTASNVPSSVATTLSSATKSKDPAGSAPPPAATSAASPAATSAAQQTPAAGGPTDTPHDPKAVPCPESGAIICLQPGYFGLCNFGYAVPQQLAAGQVCVKGVIGAAPAAAQA
ncbi:uncharacterized protein E0L32_008735 [Thyridium curvatum]|uniref:Lytic polysaccharide monooxygenase n=1 Tax=Thyridium curvatum TaxID=1093900 RepID=A0A507B1A3_9PEZI|nr:uncharacterized protein E0L32_008735 [Thyridium curvatum]TPX10330.1 hypothetical protein E0L32_008735 [Thyridium curvatum]